MPYINSTNFGNVVVDGKKYHQVLIVGDEVVERDYEKLENLFSTSHKIGDWEIKKIFENKPEIIIIGTGQSGILKVEENFLNKAKKEGIEVIAEITPEAIKVYNERVKTGKSVNALIHTTC